ncbi:hypothetical protein AG4045_004261 [Apium graveolens]|uniref:Uncharacterized protein n=1 Tax=Apium graveolens TaxID=4045 RepID=A0A6L5BAL1_APIGR|nr:hypothetical protein AG4045_004261 [Apium graveolens]
MGFWRSVINAKKYIEGNNRNKKVERSAVLLLYTVVGTCLWRMSGKGNTSFREHHRSSE